MFNKQAAIEETIKKYKSKLNIDDLMNITPEWYFEAEKKARLEINTFIEKNRKLYNFNGYEISINEIIEKGYFQKNDQNHLNGTLYIKDRTLIGFYSSTFKILPLEVINCFKNEGFMVSNIIDR